MPKYLRCHLTRAITQVLVFEQLDSVLQNIAEKAIRLTLMGVL